MPFFAFRFRAYLIFSVICGIPFSCKSETTDKTEENKDCESQFTFGYGYQRFHRITGRADNSSKNDDSNGDVVISFLVAARSDAHILLSESASPEEADPVYEIVLGGGKNTFSDIRRMQRAQTKVTVSTPDLLSNVEKRGFWIRISAKGMLQVGSDNADVPFMFWQDPDPLYIRYYSFCTWPGVVGHWMYGCPRAKGNQSTDVKPTLSPAQRLKNDLFSNYDLYTSPSTSLINVPIHINFKHITLEEVSGTLHMIGSSELTWIDDRLAWEPSQYGGITHLIPGQSVWRPQIFLYNSKMHSKEALIRGQTLVKMTGSVHWMPRVNVLSSCEVDLLNWPWDSHLCSAILAPLSSDVRLDTGDVDYTIEWPKSSGEWILMVKPVEVLSDQIFDTTMEELYFEDYTMNEETNATTLLPTALKIQVTLRRNPSTYLKMLHVAFVLISVLSLTPCLISAHSSRRMMLHCVSLLFSAAFLVLSANSLPEFSARTPTLVIGYTVMMVVSALLTLLTVYFIRLLSAPDLNILPDIFRSLLNSWLFSAFLCLSPNEIRKPTKYGQLREENCGDIERENIRENNNFGQDQIRFVKAVDRMTLLFMAIFVAVLVQCCTLSVYKARVTS